MDPASVLLRSRKSTTGRSFFLGAAVRALDLASPSAAAHLALDLFCTPHRRTEPPHVPSHPTRRFTLEDAAGPDLSVWDWGDGPTVMLVHGWSGSAGQLSGFVGPLLRAGCSISNSLRRSISREPATCSVWICT